MEFVLGNSTQDLTNDPETKEILHKAVAYGKIDLIQYLIEKDKSALYYKLPKEEVIPLHIAVHRGKLQIVQILVEAMENLDIQDREGRTPKDYAEHSWNPQIRRFFENL